MTRMRITALICLLLVITGCWNRREIETLGFALAAGIDWDEESGLYEVTVQMVKPQALAKEGRGGEETAAWVYTARGLTVFDAIRNVTLVSPRKVWWGHTQVLVLGEVAARRGVLPMLDFPTRDGETRRLFWILVTRGKARDILTVQPKSARVGALALLDIIRVRGATSTAAVVRIHDFMIALNAPMAPTTGVVARAAHAPPDEAAQDSQVAYGPSADFYVNEAAVFELNKLVGFLEREETRGMLWVQGKVRSGIITFPCPGDPTELVGLEIINASAQIKPRLKNGRPAVTVVIRAQTNLGDKTCQLEFENSESFDLLKAALADAIRSEVEKSLTHTRQMGTDVFGFGLHFSRDYPQVWRQVEKDWKEQFRKLPVDLQVDAKVRRKGQQATSQTVK